MLYPIITFVKMIRTILDRLGLSSDAATYLVGTYGIDSMDYIALLDGIDDVKIRLRALQIQE
jgi:hypothetical protein